MTISLSTVAVRYANGLEWLKGAVVVARKSSKARPVVVTCQPIPFIILMKGNYNSFWMDFCLGNALDRYSSKKPVFL